MSNNTNNTVPQDKEKLLKDLIIVWNHNDLTWSAFLQLTEVQQILSSLFSPAQPTEDNAINFAQWIKDEGWQPAPKEFDKWYRQLQGEPLRRKSTARLYSDWQADQRLRNLLQIPAKEPAQPLEPTEDIKAWIEGEACKRFGWDKWPPSVELTTTDFYIGANAMYSLQQAKIAELERFIKTAHRDGFQQGIDAAYESRTNSYTDAWDDFCELHNIGQDDVVSDTTAAGSKENARQQASSKEPAPTDWEKEFRDRYNGIDTMSVQEIIDFIKQFVPKIVAGMRWVYVKFDGNELDVKSLPPVEAHHVVVEHETFSNVWEREFGDRGYIRDVFENGWNNIRWLDESPSLSSLIEQVESEPIPDAPTVYNNEEAFAWQGGYDTGRNAALDKLMDRIKQ